MSNFKASYQREKVFFSRNCRFNIDKSLVFLNDHDVLKWFNQNFKSFRRTKSLPSKSFSYVTKKADGLLMELRYARPKDADEIRTEVLKIAETSNTTSLWELTRGYAKVIAVTDRTANIPFVSINCPIEELNELMNTYITKDYSYQSAATRNFAAVGAIAYKNRGKTLYKICNYGDDDLMLMTSMLNYQEVMKH